MGWPEAVVIMSACLGVVAAIIKFIPGRQGEQGIPGRPGHNGGVLTEVCELKHSHLNKSLDEIKEGVAEVHRRLDTLLELRK